MGALMWFLLTTLVAALTQAEPIAYQRHAEVQSVKSIKEISGFTNTNNHLNIIDQNLAANEETGIEHHGEPMGLFTDLGHQQAEDPAQRTIVKREAKKPENKKRRRKFSKKKMQEQKDKSESKTESDESKSKSESKTEESDEDSETPEFSDLYMPWNLPPRPTRSRQPKKSEAKSHPSEISTCEEPTEEMFDPPKRYEKEVIFDD